jgi:hypothetical protein
MWQKQEEPDQTEPQKPKQSKEPAKNSSEKRRLLVFSPTSKVMEETNKTEINEFEIETHQVAFNSDFSDWDVDALRVPDDGDPNWQLYWIKSTTLPS